MSTRAHTLGRDGGAILYRLQQNPLAFARDDPTLSYGTNTGDTQRNADILRRNMGVGKTPGWEAHHIVPSTHHFDAARRAREILHRLGIDINAAENGVLLPKAIHDGLANNQEYMKAVLERLSRASTRQQGIEILQHIGQELLNGTFPR